MERNKSKTLPKFKSLDNLINYFDSNDIGENIESMPKVHFDVNIKKRVNLVALEDNLAKKVKKIAIKKHVSSETLINKWIKEKILKV